MKIGVSGRWRHGLISALCAMLGLQWFMLCVSYGDDLDGNSRILRAGGRRTPTSDLRCFA